MFDLVRFRTLARRALEEKDPAKLRKLVDQMVMLLRVEQNDLKQEIEDRISHYPEPPHQPWTIGPSIH